METKQILTLSRGLRKLPPRAQQRGGKGEL
jgi:hypothetical protein